MRAVYKMNLMRYWLLVTKAIESLAVKFITNK